MKGNGRIIALEPDPENFSFLLKTVAANVGGNVECIQKAASDHAGSMTLFTNSNNRGDNRLYSNQLATSTCEVDVTHPIDTLLLAGWVCPRSISSRWMCRVTKGHVLAGMRQTITNSPRLTLLSEFWPDGLRKAGSSPEAYMSGLEACGLELFELHEKGQLEKVTDSAALIARYTGRQYTNIVGVKTAVNCAVRIMIRDLAIVIPTFNERANVEPLLAALSDALTGIAFEVIFVDDDSPG